MAKKIRDIQKAFSWIPTIVPVFVSIKFRWYLKSPLINVPLPTTLPSYHNFVKAPCNRCGPKSITAAITVYVVMVMIMSFHLARFMLAVLVPSSSELQHNYGNQNRKDKQEPRGLGISASASPRQRENDPTYVLTMQKAYTAFTKLQLLR